MKNLFLMPLLLAVTLSSTFAQKSYLQICKDAYSNIDHAVQSANGCQVICTVDGSDFAASINLENGSHCGQTLLCKEGKCMST